MIVITTPTGQIGGRLLQILLEQSTEPLRVIARDPGKLPETARDRAEVVTGSHGDPEVLERAFDGADAVFWLPPTDPHPASLAEMYTEFTRPAAKTFTATGIGHVVGVSALGRGTPVADDAGHVTASLAMDDLIGSTGVAYRALANPSFMDNLLWQVPLIREQGVFTGTDTADRTAPSACTGDIAAAAARLLLDRSWNGTGEVPVLGPEDISANDKARIMSEVLGRPIRYQWESLEEFRTGMTDRGLSAAAINGYVDMMRAKNEGLDDGVTRTADTASPTSFRTWCEQVLEPAVRA
ncbi:NAD(P)H-binding protein [Sciscionella sediminilitoris]|uniref:NAD(P)H-binding protein n=1 Tax=Sciscionella sediminilitoris TaxID=1445613 RepID=UPI0004DF482A|nr:NAD(P)H-binding protein [Sciscionella sp. SE31]